MKRRKNATLSYSSPRSSSRACLCPDGRTYSIKCCDGTLEAQGIGSTHKVRLKKLMIQKAKKMMMVIF